MPKNIYDLGTVTVSFLQTAAGEDLGLGAVPAGRKRFITYIKVHCKRAANIVQLGSATSAATALSKVQFDQKVDDLYEYPDRLDMESPLFAVGSGGYVGAVALVSATSGTMLTLQYYDK